MSLIHALFPKILPSTTHFCEPSLLSIPVSCLEYFSLKALTSIISVPPPAPSEGLRTIRSSQNFLLQNANNYLKNHDQAINCSPLFTRSIAFHNSEWRGVEPSTTLPSRQIVFNWPFSNSRRRLQHFPAFVWRIGRRDAEQFFHFHFITIAMRARIYKFRSARCQW